MNRSIGADPELFVQKANVLLNGYGLIPGTKEEPFKVEGGAVQVDGMALEFNIDPANNYEEWETNLTKVMDTLLSMTDGCEFYDGATANFDQKFFDEQPENSKVLGCGVDFCAYLEGPNMPPKTKLPMRTAGGHVHIGGFPTDDEYSEEHMTNCAKLSILMDYCVGIPSLLWDDDTSRRKMYGRAGCYRPKTYGVEYRTLSNKWIFDKKLREIVYTQTNVAVDRFLEYSFKLEDMINVSEEINSSNTEFAKEFITMFPEYFGQEFMRWYNERL